jgi:hypothetical protein
MALPDFARITQGTPIIWGEAGASGVTNTLSVDGLANATARMGAAADLGEYWDDEYLVYLVAETGTAPTAGATLDLYLVCSYNNTTWPAKVTGNDAAYTLGTSDANLRQAGATVVCLIATNDGNTTLVQAPVIWRPTGRYVVPILDNNLGQALRDEATATNNDTRVILVPRRSVIVDTVS